MTKAKAIAKKCLECSGDSPKDVTICHLTDCPLWEYRFGYSMKDKRYVVRMKKAWQNYQQDAKQLRSIEPDAYKILFKGII